MVFRGSGDFPTGLAGFLSTTARRVEGTKKRQQQGRGLTDSKHIAAAGNVPHLHAHGMSSNRSPRMALPHQASHISLPPEKPSLQKGTVELPQAIGTLMMTDTLCHCWGSVSAWRGDPDPSQPHREHIPRTFFELIVGVPWKGTLPPVPGRGRGKDLHTMTAVDKLLLSFSLSPTHPRNGAEPGSLYPPGTIHAWAFGAGRGCEVSQGCRGHWDKQGDFSGEITVVNSGQV